MDALLNSIAPSKKYRTMNKLVSTHNTFLLVTLITFCGCITSSRLEATADLSNNNSDIITSIVDDDAPAAPAAPAVNDGDVPFSNDTTWSQLTYDAGNKILNI